MFTSLSKVLKGRSFDWKTTYLNYSYSLLPLGFAVWAAFLIRIFLRYSSYIFYVISDPFGWGWNIFGTKNYQWTPFYPEAVPYLQISVILLGLFATLYVAYATTAQLFRGDVRHRCLTPLYVFTSMIALLLIRFIV